MNMTRLASLLGCTLFVGLALPAVAQQNRDRRDEANPRSWAVGATFALTLVRHTGGSILWYTNSYGVVTRRMAQSGTGAGYQAGLAIEHRLDPAFSIGLRTVYDRRPGRFEVVRACECDGQDVEYTDVTAITFDVVTSDVLLSAQVAQVDPTFSVLASAGFSIGYVVTALRTANSGSPIGHGNQRRDDEPISSASDWRLSAIGGVGARWNLAERIALRPGVFVDVGITDVTDSESWKVNSILLQLDLMLLL